MNNTLHRSEVIMPRWSKATSIFVLLVGMSVFTSWGTAVAQSNRMTLPTRALLDRYGLERVWWNQVSLNAGRDRVGHVTVYEDLVFVRSTSGTVSAFDAETGRRLWANQLGRRDHPGFPVVANDQYALVTIGTSLYAVDKWTGDLAWELQLPRSPSTEPGLDDRKMYVGTLDGSVLAFSLKKIHELYGENRLPAWSASALNWRYKTAKTIDTPPVSNGRLVQFASRDGSLYSVEADDRDLLFQFETNAPVSAPLAHTGNSIFLASEDYNFYCVNKETGETRWEIVTGRPIRKAPALVGPEIFLTPERGGIYCLSTVTGRQIWWRPKVTRFLAATNELVYARDESDAIRLLSRRDGGTLGVLPLTDFSVPISNLRTDRLFLCTPTGMLVCIREKNQPLPLYHLHPERRPILPEFGSEEEQPENGAVIENDAADDEDGDADDAADADDDDLFDNF